MAFPLINPILQFFDNSGNVLSGGKLFSYEPGTTTKKTTWSDENLSAANANPIPLDSAGRCTIFLTDGAEYKFVLSPSTDTDPPTAPIRTVDEVKSPSALTAANIGAALYATTVAETAASVTPVNFTYPPGNVLRYGTNTTPGTTDMTSAIQAAHNQGGQSTGARPYLPAGSYLITTAINPCVLGMYGDGAKRSKLICSACNAFTIPSGAGWDRPQVIFEKFAIDSNNGTSCDGNWCFYFGGVASGAAAVYNSGFAARDLAIGRTNRMGGGFYLKDVFDANVENVIFTHVSRMVQVVGSVVQSNFRRVRSFNDSQGSSLSNYGISTEAATYDTGTLTPENLRFIDCTYIRGSRGINHTSGLVIEFINLDCEADAYGMLLNAPCTVQGGLVAPGTGAAAWVGIFRGVSISNDDDATFIHNVDINCLRAPGTPASSYGIDAGDNVSPVSGLVITNCRFRGTANSLQSAFRGRILNDCTFCDNMIRTSVVTGTNDVDASGERLFFMRNRNASGVWRISDAGSATAYGEIKHNKITTLTASLTTTSNWDVGPNEAISTKRPATELGTYTGTLTGCTTSPTGTLRWERIGNAVILYIPAITGTSNTTAATITGMPADIRPNRTQDCSGFATDNSVNGICRYRVNTSGVIDMFFGAAVAGWTAAGTKGSGNSTITYSLG